ncbi:MAG: Asp23/Gls24 family envelope stress response protein [Erysipelotrichaceae bacterium]|nr:Asp23/Gls24 family envelope stress response protein [Erysipelotrichaceae bacterium]MDD3923479.1 Asp23/Gls24 family envelope stress response protein [Erysipelotrichaceae bacterium]MDD4642214.1 Asp23/Gls24 family envelope stress response protein [Erysipelotrichaceae bacterium]
MGNEYINMNVQTNDNSKIALSKVVFEAIIKSTLKEDSKAVLPEENALGKYVSVKTTDNNLSINLDIKVKFGSNVNDVCERLQEKIFQNIYQMTEIKCYFIDIHVIGFVF